MDVGNSKQKKSIFPAVFAVTLTVSIVLLGAWLIQRKKQPLIPTVSNTTVDPDWALLNTTASTQPPIDSTPTSSDPQPAAQDLPVSVTDTTTPASKSGTLAPPAFVIQPSTDPVVPTKTTRQEIKANAAAIAGTATSVAIGVVLPRVLKRLLYGKTGEKMVAKTTLKLMKLASKQLEKVALKLGRAGLTKLGGIAARKAGTLATEIATQQALVGATGPAAPFIECAMFLFDGLSIGLDLGDAGGYMKLSTKKTYLKMKADLEAALVKAYQDQGATYPNIVSPLDKISEADLDAAVEAAVSDLLAQPDNPYIKPFSDAMLASGIDFSNDDAVNAWSDANQDLIDTDGAHAAAYDNVCVANGGMVLGSDHTCSWATKEGCEGSYSWPPGENDTYAEWKSQAGGPGQPACLTASYGVRGICSTNNLPYDSDRGICLITEQYCLTKSATWEYDNDIGENDCKIPVGQQFAEAIFGTTITSGLNQVFNPSQYSKCPDGAIDDG